ncbi:hypothetical protein C5167_037497 [Papaver somniferum]|uniref:Uncharacterized protein n=1 Tax=Papaver somniferum TaxID=3469 RepID=A0A4Y7IA88_PAPSO|nr:hypothetical protein C5167_037497 [Papaver somniferum]
MAILIKFSNYLLQNGDRKFVIENEIWEPKPSLYVFLFFSSFLSIFILPYFSNNPNRSSPSPDLPGGTVSSLTKSSFLRFQRSFLLLYSLASVIQGLQSVFGEFEYAYYGVSKDQMVITLCIGSVAAILIATLLGMISDIIGRKKVCVLEEVHNAPYFETWTVTEHDKACLATARKHEPGGGYGAVYRSSYREHPWVDGQKCRRTEVSGVKHHNLTSSQDYQPVSEDERKPGDSSSAERSDGTGDAKIL